MKHTKAKDIALKGLTFLLSEDNLRDRFMAITGILPDEIKELIDSKDFLIAVLDFYIQHEPDLLRLAEAHTMAPELIVSSWRELGGGLGQEW